MATIQDAQPHHYWWVSVALFGLQMLRKVVKLNGEESAAWDLIVNLLQNLG